MRYKQSAFESTALIPAEKAEVQFIQWVADNVDHNLKTLTGKGTLHGMGVISVSSSSTVRQVAVNRQKEGRKEASFIKERGISIVNYYGQSYIRLHKLEFKSIVHQADTHNLTAMEMSYNLLLQSSCFFSSPTNPQPNWSGFMQEVTSDFSRQREDSINFLPITDLNPSDENCIFSTLLFIIDQAKKLNVEIPSVTFDQPLRLKATWIIQEAKLNIVCRLRGFHTMMSFLGSSGELMKGLGLEDLFGEVYAKHSVTHMMSDKAVSRALRAHF